MKAAALLKYWLAIIAVILVNVLAFYLLAQTYLISTGLPDSLILYAPPLSRPIHRSELAAFIACFYAAISAVVIIICALVAMTKTLKGNDCSIPIVGKLARSMFSEKTAD